MKATFNIRVQIDSNNVSTSFGSEKIEDMETTLLASILKMFGDMSGKVKKQVGQYYSIQKEEDSIPVNEETTEEIPPMEVNTDEDTEPSTGGEQENDQASL